LANSPRHLAKARLSGPCVWPQLRAGLEMQYDGERRTLAGGRTDAAVIANLRLTWREALPRWDTSLTIYNAFDARFGYPAGEEHLPDQIPAMGRNVQLEIGRAF
jgi:iron complex outermembrane receptor protein